MRDPPGGDDHMIDSINGAATAAPASHLQLVPKASATAAPAQTPATGATSSAADAAPSTATRVYVDRSPSGVYVYQLVDATTGQILVELPRAESDSLKVLDGYRPGAATQVSV